MMKNATISTKEILLLALLLVLLVAAGYYMLFLTPLKADLADIAAQSENTDAEIQVATAKVASMQGMQDELDNLFAGDTSGITEVAPYDNKEVIMTELNSILSQSLNYSLTFSDPDIGDDGTVRRNVNMSFTCESYAAAKAIIRDLTESRWRCLVSSISISSGEDISQGEVSCSASMTYFESTKIS